MPRAMPLLLVAAMLAIGSALEAFAFGSLNWPPKLPLALLLLLAFARSTRAGSRE